VVAGRPPVLHLRFALRCNAGSVVVGRRCRPCGPGCVAVRRNDGVRPRSFSGGA